jgi:anaerobic ribonucleoside-triphosphate reductase activating protein
MASLESRRMNLSRLHFPVTTLGFGRRVGMWFQGCSIQCPGCVSRDTWAFTGGETTVAAVCATIGSWLEEADGVTISGGEPFDQPDALEALLRWLRPRFAGDVLVFSGYAREKLAARLDKMEGLVDVLISDPFEPAAGQMLALRGSDNQSVHLLTPLAHERYPGLPTARRDAGACALDVVFDGDTVWMAGIPASGDLSRLRELLARAGFDADTSDLPTSVLS